MSNEPKTPSDYRDAEGSPLPLRELRPTMLSPGSRYPLPLLRHEAHSFSRSAPAASGSGLFVAQRQIAN